NIFFLFLRLFEECPTACDYRCSESTSKKRCTYLCNKCCKKCLCVPYGTVGNKEECSCYINMIPKIGYECP
ncbi:Protein GAST1, partial [Linum perenne]